MYYLFTMRKRGRVVGRAKTAYRAHLKRMRLYKSGRYRERIGIIGPRGLAMGPKRKRFVWRG